jgi:hypothetical protein
MMNIVEGKYPGLSWDITPEEKDGKIVLPAAEVEVAGTTYQMSAASFDKADGTIYMTPDGYSFVGKDGTDDIKKFPNGENYWICAINKDEIMYLKAVQTE